MPPPQSKKVTSALLMFDLTWLLFFNMTLKELLFGFWVMTVKPDFVYCISWL
jgi:hypothetical protein